MRAWPIIIALGCASVALAQGPVATVSSGESFEVDGVKVPVAGFPSWPLMLGDIVASGKGPAVISFGDRGRVVMDRNSRVQLQPGPAQPSVRLLQGALSVRRGRGPGLLVMALDRTIVPPAGGELGVAVDGNNVLTGPDTATIQLKSFAASSGSSATLNSSKPGARPKPSPTPTPTPPPPPSPK